MGVMGIHRNVIHPRFGNFILLGTILVAAPITEYGVPLDYSPCLECKLCVAACPVGAIKKDGDFDFVACSVHNYREFMGGFTDWAQTVADSTSAADFRERVSDSENASMWQSLSFKANYKAAYCLAVCPAGEEVIEPYLDDRKAFMDLVLKPLQQKKETLYVLPNSAAQAHAERRYPHKTVKVVDSGIGGRTG
jgi:Fe-S-cluster-containing hydrogenase component 2